MLKKGQSDNKYFASDSYRFGDLFGMSYIPGFKIPAVRDHIKPVKNCFANNINVYAVCDSYVWDFVADKKLYCGADTFIYAITNIREKLHVKLNPKKQNVLLLEFSERNVRGIVNDSTYIDNLLTSSDRSYVESPESDSGIYASITNYLFNKKIEKNLELNTWDYAFLTPVKNLKTYINSHLLHKEDNGVEIAPDNKRLLLKVTTDSLQDASSFQNVSDKEVNHIVDRLNSVYTKAKLLGYNNVLLSIIPNPVSIYYPNLRGQTYNNLLSRIQNSPALKLKVIDVYTPYKASAQSLYYPTDTHWNSNGIYIWLNQVNAALAN